MRVGGLIRSDLYSSPRWRVQRGFTLLELILTIIIIGILTAMAIPKFVSLRGKAKQAQCDMNRGAVNSAIATQYAVQLAGASPNPNWMSTVSWVSVTAAWFSTNVVPVCPFGVAYTITNGQVVTAPHLFTATGHS